MAGGIILISANTHKIPYPVYPLGVSYLKTWLERTEPGLKIEILDCNLDSDQAIAAALADGPLMVGLSLRNADGANSLEQNDFVAGYRRLAALVRQHTTAPLVVGGAAFSIFPERFMTELGADYGITGEGEQSLCQLAESLRGGTPDHTIEGLVWRDGAEIRTNPRKCYLGRLEVEFESRLVDYYWRHSGMLGIQTQRGCPFGCVYCSYPVIEGRRVRSLQAEAVVESIARLKRDKGVDYFFFTDSVFNISDENNAIFAEALIRSGVKISWGAYFSPRGISSEKMSLWARSGLTHIEFGTESISDECLAAYGKSFTAADVVNASRVCLENNVFYSHFLILGGWGETESTVAETIDNSRHIRHSVFFPYVGMRIYPKTQLRRLAVERGEIAVDDELFTPRYYTAPGLDLERTREMALGTGKAWIFPDDPLSNLMDEMRLRRGRKGPLWEYLRKP